MSFSLSKERLAFVERLHAGLLELLSAVTFNQSPHQDGYMVCLYASMIELFGGIALLINNDRKTALSPVFRTFLEAYVDFKNVVADRTYVKHTFARHHDDWIKVLGEKRESNPLLQELHGHEKRAAALERHESELETLNKEGFRRLTVAERFARAEMLNEYFSAYHFESDAIHNSWQSLISRHFEEADDGYQLVLYKERSLDDYDSYLNISSALLLDATERIHDHLKSGKQAEIEALKEELDAIRARAGGNGAQKAPVGT